MRFGSTTCSTRTIGRYIRTRRRTRTGAFSRGLGRRSRLKGYRVGYQGDWTDPRTGDVNQAARWYNPGTGTFTSRDTMTYDAGVPCTRPNLYAYAGANPLTFHDPDGQMFHDAGGGGNCKPIGRAIDWNGDFPIRELVCDPPKPPKPPPPPRLAAATRRVIAAGARNGTATRSPPPGERGSGPTELARRSFWSDRS
ncbi:RHS repeat-associated core domain-containing protein [Kribbella sp. CA-247076]|uniref:RHS repeat-associated core domain-containing protein n=1 Tax=Kribbella sp. CA-247076 TaxID=3239941 RepID=UPI003D8CB135